MLLSGKLPWAFEVGETVSHPGHCDLARVSLCKNQRVDDPSTHVDPLAGSGLKELGYVVANHSPVVVLDEYSSVLDTSSA